MVHLSWSRWGNALPVGLATTHHLLSMVLPWCAATVRMTLNRDDKGCW
jgi:hypothetical protein